MEQLPPLEFAFVEEVGSIYEAYGLKRLHGLVIGLLLTGGPPRSLDEIAGPLGRSKGPISEAVRQLSDIGLLRRAEGPLPRRDYYAADPDLFVQNFRNNLRTVRRNRETAERFLGAVRAQQPDAAAWIGHLATMQAFYAQMEAFYARFEADWAARPLLGVADAPAAGASAAPSNSPR